MSERGVTWGARKENGIWVALCSRWRVRARDRDAVFVAAWRFRVRIVKPLSPTKEQTDGE